MAAPATFEAILGQELSSLYERLVREHKLYLDRVQKGGGLQNVSPSQASTAVPKGDHLGPRNEDSTSSVLAAAAAAAAVSTRPGKTEESSGGERSQKTSLISKGSRRKSVSDSKAAASAGAGALNMPSTPQRRVSRARAVLPSPSPRASKREVTAENLLEAALPPTTHAEKGEESEITITDGTKEPPSQSKRGSLEVPEAPGSRSSRRICRARTLSPSSQQLEAERAEAEATKQNAAQPARSGSFKDFLKGGLTTFSPKHAQSEEPKCFEEETDGASSGRHKRHVSCPDSDSGFQNAALDKEQPSTPATPKKALRKSRSGGFFNETRFAPAQVVQEGRISLQLQIPSTTSLVQVPNKRSGSKSSERTDRSAGSQSKASERSNSGGAENRDARLQRYKSDGDFNDMQGFSGIQDDKFGRALSLKVPRVRRRSNKSDRSNSSNRSSKSKATPEDDQMSNSEASDGIPLPVTRCLSLPIPGMLSLLPPGDKDKQEDTDVCSVYSASSVQSTYTARFQIPADLAKVHSLSERSSRTSASNTVEQRVPRGKQDRNSQKSRRRSPSGASRTSLMGITRPLPDESNASSCDRAYDAIADFNFKTKGSGQLSMETFEAPGIRHVWGLLSKRVVMLPYSFTRMFWDFLCAVCVVFDLYRLPLQILAFKLGASRSGGLQSLSLATCIFWSMDLVASCLTGFMRPNGDVELHPPCIIGKRLSRWLLIDATFVVIGWLREGTEHFHGLQEPLGLVLLLRVFRLARTQLANTYTFSVPSEAFAWCMCLMECTFVTLGLLHVVTCTWAGLYSGDYDWETTIGAYEGNEWKYYGQSFHRMVGQLCGGSSTVTSQPRSSDEQTFATVVSFLGYLLSMGILGRIASRMVQLHMVSAQHLADMCAVNEFLTANGVSRSLSWRILSSARTKTAEQKSMLCEDDLLPLRHLGGGLQKELHYQLHSPILMMHPLFKYMEVHGELMFRRVAQQAVSMFTVTQDTVVFQNAETPKTPSWLFMINGRMQYVHRGGEEVNVAPGAWLCEQCMWTNWIYHGTLAAMTPCRLAALDARRFKEVASFMPASKKINLNTYATEFVRALNWHFDHERSDMGSPGDADRLMGLSFPDFRQYRKSTRQSYALIGPVLH
eukprot:TRINITY_DN26146_c0_g2_i1.p1 TRINITY_DN26146_c0_g2~~TRINITY_DN26146_c0_g2_i1.p1  ORF type:complete len:1126 (+),score=184.95 TRINITY_DN26146_c0_g2_i1:90-3467(+)